MRTKLIWSAVVASAAVVLSGSSATAVEVTTAVADHPCATATQRCDGTIEVPLDRAAPEGEKIKVSFDFQPARRGVSRAEGTLVGLVGGPMTANPLEDYRSVHDSLRERFNLLTVDYRGTGASHLYCAKLASPAYTPPTPEGVGACAEQLGERAQLYGTVNIADDLEAVRQALGLGALNVLGRSYGTYVGQVFAVRHPTSLRSLTLDSTLPLDADLVDLDPISFRWLRTLLSRACTPAASPCAGVADPLGQWTRLVTNARADRFPVRPEELVHLQLILPSRGRAGDLIAAAVAANRGDDAPLTKLVADYPLPTASSRPAEVPKQDDTSLSPAMSLAIVCSDFQSPMTSAAPARQRTAELDAAIGRLPADTFAPFTHAEYRSSGRSYYFSQICESWTAPTERRDLDIPEAGPFPRTPTLLIAGELDERTTPEQAEQVARRFPDSHVMTLPRANHTPTGSVDCAAALVRDFVTSGQFPASDTQCTG